MLELQDQLKVNEMQLSICSFIWPSKVIIFVYLFKFHEGGEVLPLNWAKWVPVQLNRNGGGVIGVTTTTIKLKIIFKKPDI